MAGSALGKSILKGKVRIKVNHCDPSIDLFVTRRVCFSPEKTSRTQQGKISQISVPVKYISKTIVRSNTTTML